MSLFSSPLRLPGDSFAFSFHPFILARTKVNLNTSSVVLLPFPSTARMRLATFLKYPPSCFSHNSSSIRRLP